MSKQMNHTLANLAYSAVLPARVIHSLEEDIEHVLIELGESARTPTQLATTAIMQILATSYCARRANHLSPVHMRQLRQRVGKFLVPTLRAAARQGASIELVYQKASPIILRMVFLAVAPEYLEVPYNSAIPAVEKRRVMRLWRATERSLRKIKRGYTMSGIVLEITMEAFLRQYREEASQYMIEDLLEVAHTIEYALQDWRATLDDEAAHPSAQECEQGAPIVVRVLLTWLKRDAFLLSAQVEAALTN